MHKLWLIIKREYLIRVKKKSFIIITLLTPLAFGLFIIGSGLLAKTMADSKKSVLVKDDTGIFERNYEGDGNILFDFTRADVNDLKNTYKTDGYDMLLVIPAVIDTSFKTHNAQYFAEEKIGLTTLERIESIISYQFENYKMEKAGIDKAMLEDFKVDVGLQNGYTMETAVDEAEKSTATDKTGKLSLIIATVLGGVMGFLMYMVIFIFGSMVMRSVMEEKVNRIVEVMISTVKPFELMLGKVIGVGGVGLTQLLLWVILIPVIAMIAGIFVNDPMQAAQMTDAMTQLPQDTGDFSVAMVLAEFKLLNWWVILPVFIIFFLGGYLIYSSLFAAIGSAMGDDMGESQGLMWPIVIPVIFAFMIMMNTLENPNSSLAVFGSIFPLFSPIVMPARLVFDPPAWQIITSLVLLVLTALLFIWISGRIYRIGILMYGKKVTLKEVGKWLFRA
ncbi:MAG TPA: ABC transporter permease [Saprospiraceae bacterium]|nr:ABC transporter permease [Saprospiraceae bacterium]